MSLTKVLPLAGLSFSLPVRLSRRPQQDVHGCDRGGCGTSCAELLFLFRGPLSNLRRCHVSSSHLLVPTRLPQMLFNLPNYDFLTA